MKKKLVLALMTAALLLTFAACQNDDKGAGNTASGSTVSRPVSSQESSAVSETSSEASQESSAGSVVSSESSVASEAESSANDGTGNSPLPNVETGSSDFKTKFMENPIDADFNEDISLAASESEIVSIITAATESWKDAVDSAYQVALDSCATEDASAKVKAAQVAWAETLENNLDSIREKGDDAATTAMNLLQVYRQHAAELLEMAFNNNGDYAFPMG